MIRLKRDFPRQIIIKDNIWQIRFCRNIPREPTTTVGLCDPNEQVIWIRDGQKPEERFKTAIHEICHAVCYEYGIKECHSTIYKLEGPILALLLDNGVVL